VGETAGTRAGDDQLREVTDVAHLVQVQEDSTVSRTVLKAEGVRVVLFAFDAGQVLTEHTAAMPVLLQTLDGHLRITADGRTVDLRPGDLVHLTTRLPHSVEAVIASRLMLTMIDARQAGTPPG
jgi:quercetin dioxygenase-like cupin family protein